MQTNPLFITFEGGEGAGKSTLIERVAAVLQKKGRPVVTTREPGGTQLGEHIRHWLLNRDFIIKVSKPAELMLFLASRAQHLEELIVPALGEGKDVICDRFCDSTIVYQGYARGLGVDYVERLCQLVCQGLAPQLTFYLDVDPAIGLKRSQRVHKEIAKAGTLDRIESESLEFHQKVRKGFLDLAKRYPERIHIIDASQTIEKVGTQVIDILESCLKTS